MGNFNIEADNVNNNFDECNMDRDDEKKNITATIMMMSKLFSIYKARKSAYTHYFII